MGVVDRIKQVFLRSDPPNPNRTRVFSGLNLAGIHVTPQIAFQVSAVWACIDVISSAIASSDWNVHEWLAQDKQSFLYNDPLQSVLNTRMNPEMTAISGKRALMIAAVSSGNGYAEIVRDLTGRPAFLWPIAPDRVTPYRDSRGLYFKVYNDGQEPTYLDSMDVFHIRGPGIDGILGDDLVGKAVRSIALSIAQERFAETYFANNAQLGLIVKTTELLDDAHYERLKEQLEVKHGGVRKSHKTLILEKVSEIDRDTIDAEKTQLVDARYQQLEEIARWFHVPPHKIGHLLRATNNNIEHQGLEFTRDALRPWKVEIEQEAEYKLFSARGRPRFVVVDTSWASQGDFKSRAEGYQILRMMGVYSANDVLRKEGENTIGPEGDLRIVNGAAIPLEHVGENYRNTGTPVAPEAPADPGLPTEAPQPQPKEGPNKPTTKAVMQAWLASIYSRVGRQYENRKANLAGRTDADEAARSAARDYLAGQLAEFEPHANSWAGRDIDYYQAGLAVLDGRAAEEAAAEAIGAV